ATQTLVENQKKTPKEILFDRRPDIAHIELSCENTDTPVPYVDLVNEILEYKIANESFPAHIATDGTATELSANPQAISPTAYQTCYETLAQKVFPWNLPFNVWLEEARVYFKHLGIARYQLLEAFQKTIPPYPPPVERMIATEHLGLSDLERQII